MNQYLKSILMAVVPVAFDWLREQAQKSETELDDALIDVVEAPLLELIGKL